MEDDMKALTGLRVLDVTQMLAGPIAGMRLGDLGADVIKVEPPATGESNRTFGYGGVKLGGHTTTFLALNRNKRSIAIDFKSPAGREIFYDLVRESDVVLQNFRVGAVQRLGIDYETLREINPRIIYASISGYGSSGPGAGRPGQDLVLQGYSGSMWFVGSNSDAPQPGGLPAIDAMTGYQTAIGVLAAVVSRATTGEGQHVEVDMLSVVMDARVQELVTYLNTGLTPQRREEPSAHAWIPAPYGVHRTSDGWMTMAMCPVDVLGRAIGNDRLATMDPDDSLAHTDEVVRIIRPILEGRTTAEWIAHFDTFNIWTGPVYDYSDLESDPQVVARGLITTIVHPEAGPMRTAAVPLTMSGTPATIDRPAPLLGEHTEEILRDLATATGDSTNWDPTVSYEKVHSSVDDLNSTQGMRGWYYQKWNGSSYSNLTWNTNKWEYTGTYLAIDATHMHPESSYDAVRKWVAPSDGRVTVSGTIQRPAGTGDGVVATTLLNGTTYWSQSISGTDTAVKPFSYDVTVHAGDAVYFRLNRNSTIVDDTTTWQIGVTYSQQKYDASADFSSTQGLNGWNYLRRNSGTDYALT